MRKEVDAKAELTAEERVLDALVGENASADDAPEVPQDAARRASSTTRRSRSTSPTPARRPADLRHPRHARRADGHDQSQRHLRQGVRRPAHQAPTHDRRGSLRRADRRGERQAARRGAGGARRPSSMVEQNGIVFLDEIDKICGALATASGADVSREGVQRDLLPLIEGTTVATKHGPVQDRPHPVHRVGRLPPRQAVRPAARAAGPAADPGRAQGADRDDFKRILTEPENSLIRQYTALLGDRGGDARLHRGGDRRARAARRRDQRESSRISARGGCTR